MRFPSPRHLLLHLRDGDPHLLTSILATKLAGPNRGDEFLAQGVHAFLRRLTPIAAPPPTACTTATLLRTLPTIAARTTALGATTTVTPAVRAALT